ncbi:MAG: AI-2E family transporter [Candidatus Taylorbacteria bacterium]|nr:AI-2E family transporter [Candidatus Taylorbacteria bacterium]
MTNYKLQISFFTVLITGAVFLSFFVLKPYLSALFIAIILRIVFDSFHARALSFSGGRETVAALLSVAAVIILTIVPFVLIGFFLFDDARSLYVKIIAGQFDADFIEHLTAPIYTFLQQFIPGFSFDILHYVKQGLGLMLGNIGSIFSSLVNFIFQFTLMILALFYLFRDGSRFRQHVIFLSPLSDRYDENILTKLAKAVKSVLMGSLLISCIQGILAAVGFLIFSVPNPIFWGAITAVAALVPTFGTALVIVPAVIFLFWSGAAAAAFGLIVWSAVVVGLVDNLIAPHLMARGIKIHPFIILLSVLGGLWFFGPIGFLAGPVVITLLLTLLDMYPTIIAGASISPK